MSTNTFQDVLTLASALGLEVPKASTLQLTADADKMMQACDTFGRIYAQQLVILEQEDFMAWEQIAHRRILHNRKASLEDAVAILTSVLAKKEAITKRIRLASLGPSIAVDPAQQPALSALLQNSATGQAVLAEGLDVLQWAANFQERPSCWEDHLHAIPEALRAFHEHAQALAALSQALQCPSVPSTSAQQARICDD